MYIYIEHYINVNHCMCAWFIFSPGDHHGGVSVSTEDFELLTVLGTGGKSTDTIILILIPLSYIIVHVHICM